MKYTIIILNLFYCFNNLYAQDNTIQDSSIFITMFSGEYSLQVPEGDLKERFGINSNIGSSCMFKLKSNIVFGLTGNFMYGNNVKEDGILDSIKTSDGNIINKYGEYANILISERGFFLGGKFGFIIPVLSPNPNSGLMCYLSVGLLQHKIKIENDGNNAPQVLGDYRKGYDRLTNGFAISEFIGYIYFGKKQIVNFYTGIELYQAWTKNRRSFNYDTMERDERERHDYLISFKFGWIIPIYKKKPLEYYTY